MKETRYTKLGFANRDEAVKEYNYIKQREGFDFTFNRWLCELESQCYECGDELTKEDRNNTENICSKCVYLKYK